MKKYLIAVFSILSFTIISQNSEINVGLINVQFDSQNLSFLESGTFSSKSVNINSKYSEYGGYSFGDTVYFCSTKNISSDNNKINIEKGKSLNSLFFAKKKRLNIWVKTKIVESIKNLNVCSICFTNDQSVAYITIDVSKENENIGKKNLKIYKVKIDNKGSIINSFELPFNSNEYSSGYPTISNDGKTIYFSSDRPDGFGGADIYKATIFNDNTFGLPVNLGQKVNSEGNEVFPWITKDDNLFFSSDGLNGFGGLDIYFIHNEHGEWINLTNLGESLNSKQDDFGLILNKDEETGFFSSNRQEEKVISTFINLILKNL
jgi:hypothetical protein